MSGPLHPAWSPLTIPASWLYGGVMRIRNGVYGRGIGVRRVDVPVISVGNLSVGGTGKTPIVQWVARTLVAADRRPAVCLRGYAPSGATGSDEADEHREALPGTPVLTGGDRVRSVREAMSRGEAIDAVVLDDAFQHRRLHRDLDIVLIDAGARTPSDRVLPAGWLREPRSGLRRADAIVVTRAAAVDQSLAGRIADLAGRPPVAWVDHVWSGIRQHPAGTASPDAPVVPAGSLSGRRIAVMAGVGRPEHVAATARGHGAEVVHIEPVRDHQPYDAAGLSAALGRARASGAEALLVTRKDRVKLHELAATLAEGPPLLEPVLSVEFVAGETELASLVRSAVAG